MRASNCWTFLVVRLSFAVAVLVQIASGQSGEPVVTGITPSSGAPGTSLPATISGSNLSGATAVSFSGSGVTATIGTGGTATSLPITVTIAAGAATDTRTFAVTTPAGTSPGFSGFTVTSGEPVVTGITPSSGAPGTSLPATISGSNLSGATAVSFSGSGVTATIGTGGTATSLPITVTIDANAGLGARTVTVTTPNGTSAPLFSGFTVTQARPVITGISPNSGVVNSTLGATVSGTGFTGATAVVFSGSGVTATIGTGRTDTSLPVRITIASDAPPTARSVNVIAPQGNSDPFNSFMVTSGVSAPTISALDATLPGLSQAVAPWYGGPFVLTVNGTNFDAGAVVSLGATNLTTTRVSGTQLAAQVTGAALATIGNQGVKVTNPSGLFSNIVQLWDIERGDLNGDRKVNIGDALVCALTVGGTNKPALPNSVGDMNLNGTTNIGDCLVLALFAGRVNPNFTVPVITSVSPSVAVRGSPLTITGTGFSANTADNQVLFTSIAEGVTRVSVSTATTTSLTVTVPNDAVSGPMQALRVDTPLGGAEFGVTVSGTPTPLVLAAVDPYFQVAEGASVTLTGMGFDATPANNTVLFKSAAGTVSGTVTAATTTSLTVTVPAGAVCGPVTAGVGGQTSNARTVTIAGTTCALQLVDVWGGGSPGDVVVLEGAGFDVGTPANNVVKFTSLGGSTVTAPVLAAGGTQLHVRIPDTAAQGDVTVTVGATTSNPITYTLPSAMVLSSIDVVVNSANPVGSFQVTIGYNKNVVHLDAANVTGGMGPGFTGAPVTINIDNATGSLTINAFQTGNSPTGTFTVAHLVFTPIAAGTSNLTLSAVTLTDTAGNDLPANRIVLSSDSITVRRVP